MGTTVAQWVRRGLQHKCASPCNTDTTPTQPHRNSNTHRTKNNTTNAVIQKNSSKLLMMDILMSETCWAYKKWDKIASDIKFVFYSTVSGKLGVSSVVCYQYARVEVCSIIRCSWTSFWMPGQVLNDCLPRLCLLLTHPYRAVRHMAARCLGTLACLSSVPVMTHVVDKVLPLLGAVDSDIRRQGAVEALASISEKLQFSIVPYIVLLVVPLLGE